MIVDAKNFQSLKDVTLPVEGLTVVVGDSNTGKSALLRAVSSVLFNRSGGYFVRRGEAMAEVALTGLPGGLDVAWEKGKKPGVYTVNGDRFEKVGKGTPAPVEALYHDVELPDASLRPQLAAQQDGLFLLHETGSVMVDALAAASQLDLYGDAIRLCVDDVRTAKTRVKMLTEQVDALAGVEDVCTMADAWVAAVEPLAARLQEVEALKGRVQEAIKLVEVRAQALTVPAPGPLPALPVTRLAEKIAVTRKKFFGKMVAAPPPVPALPVSERVNSLTGHLNTVAKLAKAVREASIALMGQQALEAQARQDLSDFYAQHPTCPTCGRPQ